jgi:hypothetical protein
VRYEEAVHNRTKLFSQIVGAPEAEALRELHRSHLPEKGDLSVCMHRADAKTVSLTEVSFLSEERMLRYSLGSPCERPPTLRFSF